MLNWITNPLVWSGVLGTLGAAAGLLAVADIRRRRAAAQTAAFHALSAEAGLSRGDRLLLRRLAWRARVPVPAALLVSRGCFDFASRCGDLSPPQRERAAIIRRRVFGA
jgi:hypothetical protein